MPIMSNRIFLSLALLCLTVTFVRSYGPYGEHGIRDHGLRKVRRCPTCPTDCPGSLASPWYGSPAVYGQSASFEVNPGFEGLSLSSSYSKRQAFPSDSSNLYRKPSFERSNVNYVNSRSPYSDGGYKTRLAGIKDALPKGPSGLANLLDKKESFDIAGNFGSRESIGIEPYGYPRFSPDSFIPERYRGLSGVAVDPLENRHVSRHYGNNYKDSIIQTPREVPSFEQNSDEEYEKPNDMTYEDQIQVMETPSQKVYVVYRADKDHSMHDEDLDRSPANNSRQQRDTIATINSMTETQLEEIVRRAIASALRHENMKDEKLYDLQKRRGIYYNEQERDEVEYYDPRRLYNDAFSQRFNAKEAIDRQERRKLYRVGLGPSEASYTPTMLVNPYILPGDTDVQNTPKLSESSPGDSVRDHFRYNTPKISTWERQEFSSDERQNADEDTNKYTTDREPATTIFKESRDISQAKEGKNQQEQEKKSSANGQGFMPSRQETNFETITSPTINYRTHSRSTNMSAKGISGKEKNEEIAMRGHGMTRMPLNILEKNVNSTPTIMNPDLMEDMEMPPISDSEDQLQLSFEIAENSPPLPAN